MSLTAAQWNELVPPGTPVRFWPVRNEDEPWFEGQDFSDTRTRSEAWRLSCGEVLVSVEGITGGVSVRHLAVNAAKVVTGRAILRARERRWEEEKDWDTRTAPGLIEDLHTQCEAADAEIARLRTERDELSRAVLDAEGRAAELRVRLRDIAGILNAMEAIDVCATGVAMTMTNDQWGRADELAGEDHG
jgi:hypothetical protein